MPNSIIKQTLNALKEEIALLEKNNRAAYDAATELPDEDVSVAEANKTFRIIRATKVWREIVNDLDDAMTSLGTFNNKLDGIDDIRATAAARALGSDKFGTSEAGHDPFEFAPATGADYHTPAKPIVKTVSASAVTPVSETGGSADTDTVPVKKDARTLALERKEARRQARIEARSAARTAARNASLSQHNRAAKTEKDAREAIAAAQAQSLAQAQKDAQQDSEVWNALDEDAASLGKIISEINSDENSDTAKVSDNNLSLPDEKENAEIFSELKNELDTFAETIDNTQGEKAEETVEAADVTDTEDETVSDDFSDLLVNTDSTDIADSTDGTDNTPSISFFNADEVKEADTAVLNDTENFMRNASDSLAAADELFESIVNDELEGESESDGSDGIDITEAASLLEMPNVSGENVPVNAAETAAAEESAPLEEKAAEAVAEEEKSSDDFFSEFSPFFEDFALTDDSVNGKEIVSINLFGRDIKVKDWREFIHICGEELITKKPQVAITFFEFPELNSEKVNFSFDEEAVGANPIELSNGQFLRSNLQNDEAVELAHKMLDLCGYSADDLSIVTV
jgi:hypothetical protein